MPVFVLVRMGHDGIRNPPHSYRAYRGMEKSILPQGCKSVLVGWKKSATQTPPGVPGARDPSVLLLHFLEHKASLFVVVEETYLSAYPTCLSML